MVSPTGKAVRNETKKGIEQLKWRHGAILEALPSTLYGTPLNAVNSTVCMMQTLSVCSRMEILEIMFVYIGTLLIKTEVGQKPTGKERLD